MIRGGAWFSLSGVARASKWFGVASTDRDKFVGFRCARTEKGYARGGSWDFKPRNTRASLWYRLAPANQYDNVGFRCVRRR